MLYVSISMRLTNSVCVCVFYLLPLLGEVNDDDADDDEYRNDAN